MTASARVVPDVKRQAVLDHVLVETAHYVVATGLDATMDDIADAVGVSRRSLFRLFGTRERLIAEALSRSIARYTEGLPHYTGSLEPWLRATCQSAHRMNAAYGPGFFELTSRSDLLPELAAVERQRRQDVRAAYATIAEVAWHAVGGTGATPDNVHAAVCGHLSSGFTAAVKTYAGKGWQSTADIAYIAIMATLTESRRAT